jgi:hypothetical protein
MNSVSSECDVVKLHYNFSNRMIDDETPTNKIVTDLCKYKDIYKDEISKFFTIETTLGDDYNYNRTIQFSNEYEDVSAILGTALTYIIGGEDLITEFLNTHVSFTRIFTDDKLSRLKEIINKEKDLSTIIELVNFYMCICDNSSVKINQIKHYDWVDDMSDEFNESCHRLRLLNLENGEFEKEVTLRKGSIMINGIVDYLTEDTVFEIKLVSNLTFDHQLQTVLYCILANVETGILYNAMTMETQTITVKREHHQDLLDIILNLEPNTKTLERLISEVLA